MATVNEIQQLEKVHKEQLNDLAQANNVLLYLNKLYPAGNPKRQIVADYYRVIAPIAQKWDARQNFLEREAGIPKMHPRWFNHDYQNQVNELAKSVSSTGTLGFVPLLIWGAIAIAGLITSAYIVDVLTDTAKEKQNMITATTKACQESGLNADQCKDILTQSVKSTQGNALVDMVKPILWLGLGFMGLNYLTKNK